MIQYNGDLV